MTEPSEVQRRILDYMRRYTARHGRPPTHREIQAECELSSTSVVGHHLRKLVKAGYLCQSDSKSRGFVLAGSRTVLPGDKLRVEVNGQLVEGRYVAA